VRAGKDTLALDEIRCGDNKAIIQTLFSAGFKKKRDIKAGEGRIFIFAGAEKFLL
jgi:hypothetical protein